MNYNVESATLEDASKLRRESYHSEVGLNAHTAETDRPIALRCVRVCGLSGRSGFIRRRTRIDAVQGDSL